MKLYTTPSLIYEPNSAFGSYWRHHRITTGDLAGYVTLSRDPVSKKTEIKGYIKRSRTIGFGFTRVVRECIFTLQTQAGMTVADAMDLAGKELMRRYPG